MTGVRIGELLVEQGLLTQTQVQTILEVQQSSHRPFGDLAEYLYGVSPRRVEDAWVEQYIRTAGVIDLDEQQVDVDCLRRINRRQAWQFHVLPLHREGAEIHVATSAQGLVRAMNFAGRTLEDPIYMMIAEREQLHDFLMRHYPAPQHIVKYAQSM